MQAESQHLALLGKEWKDRELAAAKQIEATRQDLNQRERELTRRAEELETRELELLDQKKILEEDRRKLKQNKIESLQKLKKELKEREHECIEKDKQIDELRGKLRVSEQELRKLRTEKEKKNENRSRLLADIRNLKYENTSLVEDKERKDQELQECLVRIKDLDSRIEDLRTNHAVQMEELKLQLSKKTSRSPPSQEQPREVRSGSISARSGRASYSSVTSDTGSDITMVPCQQPRVSSQEVQVSSRSLEADRMLLRRLKRLEDDMATYLRAGYSPADDLIQMFQREIDQLQLP